MYDKALLTGLSDAVSGVDERGFYRFTSYAREHKDMTPFQDFLDAGLVTKEALQLWAQDNLKLLPYDGNEPFGSRYGFALMQMLIVHGIFVNCWTEDLLDTMRHHHYARPAMALDALLKLAIEKGGDVSGYEAEIVRFGSVELLQALHNRGFSDFSIYDARNLQTLRFIDRHAGGIAAQVNDGSEAWMRLLLRKVTMTRYLLETGIDLKLGTLNADTMTYLDRCRFSPELLTLLIEAGADINHQDAQGNTALHNCIGRELCFDEQMWRRHVALFLDLGADPFLPDNEGESFISLLKKKPERMLFVLENCAAPTPQQAARTVDELVGNAVIPLLSSNSRWIDPCVISYDAGQTPLEPAVREQLFGTMLLTSSREFVLQCDDGTARIRLPHRRLLAEYLLSAMHERDAMRHLEHFAVHFRTAGQPLRVQMAFLFRKALAEPKYARFLHARGVERAEVDTLLSHHWEQCGFSVKRRCRLYILPRYDLQQCALEEVDAAQFHAYIQPHPYAPLHDELHDGYVTPKGIPGLGYENDFIFTTEAAMRLRQERSILLYGNFKGSRRFPIEVYEEEIESAPKNGVFEHCHDGYDFRYGEGSYDDFLCRHRETYDVYEAYETKSREEYYGCRAITHRRPYNSESWANANRNYDEALKSFHQALQPEE